MVKFTHYLVTRFNVPVDPWSRDKHGQTTLDDTWMQHRLVLFAKYCVPTVTHQTEKNFTWLVYCSRLTEEGHRLEIENAIRLLPNAAIRFADSPGQMLDDLQNQMSDATTPYVISSRVDNDDGIGRNYIKTIQAHFKPEDKLLLNLDGGVVYDIHNKVMTQMRKNPRNHYTSLIEARKETSPLLTVLGFPHDAPPAQVRVENVFLENAWLKIIHDRNVKSRLKGRPVFFTGKRKFDGVSEKDFPVSFIQTMIYIARRIWSRVKN